MLQGHSQRKAAIAFKQLTLIYLFIYFTFEVPDPKTLALILRCLLTVKSRGLGSYKESSVVKNTQKILCVHLVAEDLRLEEKTKLQKSLMNQYGRKNTLHVHLHKPKYVQTKIYKKRKMWL